MSVMEEKEFWSRSRRSFSPEFKRDEVALVLVEGRTIADVARSLGIGETNLGWSSGSGRSRRTRGLTTSEKVERAELRRIVTRLRMERDLLNRATAFWVNESGQ